MIIKKLLITLILTLISTSAMAEWTLVIGDSHITVYADLSTIRTTDNGVRLWVLYDYKTVQEVAGDKYLAISKLDEYDCKNEKMRTLSYSFQSGNMGNGQSVASNSDTQKWEYISPYSIAEATYKIACGKN